ncbi:hypothetical protein ACJX0J_008853, partial [Zea mays]
LLLAQIKLSFCALEGLLAMMNSCFLHGLEKFFDGDLQEKLLGTQGRSGGILLCIDLDMFDIGSIDEGDFYFQMGSFLVELVNIFDHHWPFLFNVLDKHAELILRDGNQMIIGDEPLKTHITKYYKKSFWLSGINQEEYHRR